MSEPIILLKVRKYDAERPPAGYIGVPLRDLTAEDLDAMPAHIRASALADVSGLYTVTDAGEKYRKAQEKAARAEEKAAEAEQPEKEA